MINYNTEIYNLEPIKFWTGDKIKIGTTHLKYLKLYLEHIVKIKSPHKIQIYNFQNAHLVARQKTCPKEKQKT